MSRRREERASEGQVKKLCIEFSRLRREEDPRANGPRGEVYENDRAGRLTWAQEHLGDGQVVSFTLLNTRQAAYLLDILSGRETRIDAKLREFARASGILDLAGRPRNGDGGSDRPARVIPPPRPARGEDPR